MKKSFKKILIALLIVGLNWVGFSAVGNTVAMFNDIEASTENVLQAGVIDFTLTDNGFDPVEPSISMGPGDITRKIVELVPNIDSNPLQYYASSTNFAGDDVFCNALNVNLKFDDGTKFGGDTFYSESLLDFKTTATTSLNPWMFEFGAGASNFQNKTCEFDVDYNGWQTRHNYPTYENGGFSDTEKVKNKISSWGFRINKVYYDVAQDKGVEGDNEWVEIYNQTNVALDISGWEICDNQSCDVIPTTDPIPAFSFGVITASTTTWGFWNIPNNIKKIVLPDGNIGNRLGNNEDMLILKRPDGVMIDQMNWGVPNTNWNNYNDDVWNPGVTDAVEGNALARVPSGYDTDQPSDWKELAPPEIDLIYPDEAGSYTWYWGHDYDIEWTATNNNGPDSALSIDISYIKDINQDGEISNGDIEYPILSNGANTGLYNWTVPSGFIGYIWVKLIATGPENPMINDIAISGDIFDPIPVFVDNTVDTAALSFQNDEGDGELINGDEIPSISEDSDSPSIEPENSPQEDPIFDAATNDTASSSPQTIPSLTATSSISVIPDDTASTSVKVIFDDDNATSTLGVLGNNTASSTIPAITPNEIASSTPEIALNDIATSTLDIIEPDSKDIASSTPKQQNDPILNLAVEDSPATSTTPAIMPNEIASSTPEIAAQNDNTNTPEPEPAPVENTTAATEEIIITKEDAVVVVEDVPQDNVQDNDVNGQDTPSNKEDAVNQNDNELQTTQ